MTLISQNWRCQDTCKAICPHVMQVMQNRTKCGGEVLRSRGVLEDGTVETQGPLMQAFMVESSSKCDVDIVRLDSVKAVWIIDIAVHFEEDLECQTKQLG